jgi:hypothetical protein
MTASTTPTVVLVHGAFADAAGWIGVIAELQSHGIPVIAPPNPPPALGFARAGGTPIAGSPPTPRTSPP